MKVSLENIGKKFIGNQWIFRNIHFDIQENDRVAFTGHNGSGKSTLLHLIAGMSLPSEGSIHYLENDIKKETEKVLQKISFAAPYIELIEEYTLKEFLSFHFQFKKLIRLDSIQELIQVVYLNGHENKLIKNFSSGMKQRLKLALAFFSESELILLDEPTTNLDVKGIDWYLEQIDTLKTDSPIIIASNQSTEYAFCHKILEVDMTLKIK